MKNQLIAICVTMALTGAISVRGQAPGYAYKFIPTSTDLPPLNNWGGELILDARASSGGDLSDITQSESFIKTPYGEFTLADSSDVTSHETLTWSSSVIETMDITGFVTLRGVADYSWTITQSSVEIQAPDPQSPMAFGTWQYVPDSAPTAWLTGLAAAGLFGAAYVSRSRQLAMAPQ